MLEFGEIGFNIYKGHYPNKRYKTINLKLQVNRFYSITYKYSLTKIISIDDTNIYTEMDQIIIGMIYENDALKDN